MGNGHFQLPFQEKEYQCLWSQGVRLDSRVKETKESNLELQSNLGPSRLFVEENNNVRP